MNLIKRPFVINRNYDGITSSIDYIYTWCPSVKQYFCIINNKRKNIIFFKDFYRDLVNENFL